MIPSSQHCGIQRTSDEFGNGLAAIAAGHHASRRATLWDVGIEDALIARDRRVVELDSDLYLALRHGWDHNAHPVLIERTRLQPRKFDVAGSRVQING